jgi:hypothetical protein
MAKSVFKSKPRSTGVVTLNSVRRIVAQTTAQAVKKTRADDIQIMLVLSVWSAWNVLLGNNPANQQKLHDFTAYLREQFASIGDGYDGYDVSEFAEALKAEADLEIIFT